MYNAMNTGRQDEGSMNDMSQRNNQGGSQQDQNRGYSASNQAGSGSGSGSGQQGQGGGSNNDDKNR